MSKRLRGYSIISGLVILASLFIIAGCSSNSPVEPNLPQDAAATEKLFIVDVLERLTEPLITCTTELIEVSTGGIIEIERDDYVHLFSIEPGALDSDTEINVKSSREKISNKEMLVFDFGPDGLAFNIPASLDVQIAELNSNATSAKLYYYDPASSRWAYQGSSSVSGGVASFAIDHFSKYAISD